MTKEELKKEAKEELKKYVCTGCFDNENDVNDCLGCSYAEGYISGYVTGAKPREKRIAELEDESNDLCDNLETQDLKIAELEKENAELKGIKDVATLIRANNDTVVTLMQLNNKLVSKSQQLTKAKEIIKTCLGFMQAFGYSPSIDKLVTEAEQFLNSEVEK